jgi:hypothetical protein
MQLKDNSLSATVEMEYAASEGVRLLPFNLNGVLRISSITAGEGNPLVFIQEPRDLDSDPWLILKEPARARQKQKMKIIYKEDSTGDSRIVFNRGAGLYYVTSRESWFPSFGAFDDRTQFELHASSPKKYKFLASGNLLKSEQIKNELITTWKSELPLSVIGFNYGDFVDWFFHQWIYGTAIPSYDFSYQLSDAVGQTELTMTVTQSDVPDTFKMKLPVYISVKDEIRYLATISVQGTSPYRISLKLPLHPDNVLLDPGHSILANAIHQR